MTIRWRGSTRCRLKPTFTLRKAPSRLPAWESRECLLSLPRFATRSLPLPAPGCAILRSRATAISDEGAIRLCRFQCASFGKCLQEVFQHVVEFFRVVDEEGVRRPRIFPGEVCRLASMGIRFTLDL